MKDMNLLMVHADDHEPVLEGVSDDTITVKGIDDSLPEHLWDEGGDPNDLELQRWGVVAPEGKRGDRLLEIIAPLIAHRREQQGGHEVQIYRVPARMSASEAAVWKKTVFRPQTDLDIDLPRYQLVLGDLHEVPLSIQQVQGTDGFVGRIAFDDDEDYASYVAKALRWDKEPAPHRSGRAIFHTVHDGTPATRVGHSSLIEPGVAVARARMERGQFNADDILQTGDPEIPSPQELLDAVQTDRPAFLFSLSHGEGPPRSGWGSAESQRLGQGAMSFGREGRIHGDDLRDAAFLPGGVWFMLACFGAGSPEASSYAHWLHELKSLRQFRGNPDVVLGGIPQERPFIARLPKNVLASPNGPLAFFGHIDLAWTYSFQELDSGGAINRPAKFMGVLRSALKRDRLGISFRELFRFFEQTNTELTSLHDEARAAQRDLDAATRARAGHLWMLRQDLAAYVLLGDPAARMPLSTGAPARPKVSAPKASGIVGFGSAPKAPATELPLPIDELEEAIGMALVGDESLKTIAKQFGVDRGVLRELVSTYRQGGRAALGVED